MTADTWLGTVLLMATGAVSPGPNNFIVLSVSARAGLRGALPVIGGVVVGGLALITLIALGVGTLFSSFPILRILVAVLGCLYLFALGIQLAVRSVSADAEAHALPTQGLPLNAVSVALYQFVNPKGWVLMLTIFSAAGPNDLLVSYMAIAPPCLLLWAALGSLLATQLKERRVRAWFDRGMGVLLLASSWLLLGPLLSSS